ncbi:MAG: hypothetical protein IJD84_01475 [Parabacteroides sp.]|nr:hypothetical protein [Parabacteroides sp.]
MSTFSVTLGISIVLMVGGFIVPPTGIIDGSVITSVGLLLLYAVIAQIPVIMKAVRDGKTIRIQKGDFSAELSGEQ